MIPKKIQTVLSKFPILLQFNICLALVFILLAGWLTTFVEGVSKDHAVKEANEKIHLILERNLATHAYINEDLKPSVFALTEGYRPAEYFDPTWMSSTYAVREIDRYFQAAFYKGYYYKECAINARNPQNEADEYERVFIEKLNQDPQLDSRSEVVKIDGTYFLVFLHRGESLEKPCLRCHGVPDNAPQGLIELYGASRSFHRTVGETIDAISIRIPLKSAYARTADLKLKLMGAFSLVLLLIFLAQGLAYQFLIGKPLSMLNQETSRFIDSEDYFGRTISLPSSLEFKQLTHLFNTMSVHLREQFDNLRKREFQLMESQSAAKLGNWDLDLITGNLDWSVETYRLFDKDPEEFTPSFAGFAELVHPDDHDLMQSCFDAALQSDEHPYHVEVRIINENGRQWIMEAYGGVVRDETGKAVRIFGTAQDVTVRKSAETKLRESERKFKSLIQTAASVIISMKPDYTIMEFNREAELTFGRQQQEVQGKNYLDLFVPPAFHSAINTDSEKVLSGKPTYGFEYTVVAADGSERILSWNVSRIVDENGRPAAIIAVGHDITSLKRIEAALRESEERYIDLYENAPDLYISVDARTGKVVRCNQTAVKALGYSKDEILDHPVLNLYHPDYLDKAKHAFQTFLDTGYVHNAELAVLCKNGEKRDVIVNASPILDNAGNILYSRSTWRDITERKRAERKVHELNLKLEQRVRDRTRELLEKNEKLVLANQKLQGLDRLKSLFVAAMSHELRTPLNSIIGFSSITLDEWLGPLNSDQKEKLAIVLRAGKHLLALVNDVIDVSKIEAGNLECFRSDFELQDVFDEAVSLVRNTIEAKGISFKVQPYAITMHTDRQRLLQCILNLLNNAAKFTDSGQIVLKAELLSDSGSLLMPKRVVIAVSDTGIGIKKQDFKKLFVAFSRIITPHTIKTKGTGLGLYLVEKIATEILKGEVAVESTPGKGSIFRITLPVRI